MSPHFTIKRQPRTDFFVRTRAQQVRAKLQRVVDAPTPPDDDETWQIIADAISALTEIERYLVDPQLVWTLRERP